ncbi:winged helix-turn-helix domain-containing protein [Evansella sp. LMS18]|uniref:winged helix-turn-helix domain-containing protein n=1 Tax=Evansella sp. LMS18 TaxID=2924033 RepID=UPI0020D00E07|nr:winged helix-turn-helix domain-containing protein [Evansella sp. LMS18]UTR10668.1 winged helix-turn-helix domain-containing protein [Evansella sp. LMS18]
MLLFIYNFSLEGDYMALSFDINNYSVRIEGEQIELLRKEFQLLQYLYENQNHALSRQQILEAVWPFQIPSDRTVDDHIYRLRKKLKRSPSIIIETVKGIGYKLVYSPPMPHTVSITADEEFKRLSTELLKRYHLYGQGEAIHRLLDKDTFGLVLDEKDEIFLNFLRGDFLSLINSTRIPFNEKSVTFLGLYIILETDGKKIEKYIQKFESKNLIPEEDREEIHLLKVFLYIKTDQLEKARPLLLDAEERITEAVPGFYGFYQLGWFTYALCLRDAALAKTKMEVLEKFFEKNHFQREYGLFLVLKGFYYLSAKQPSKGTDLISHAFTVLEKARFPIQTLMTILVSEKLLILFKNESVGEFISLKKEEVYERYNIIEVKRKIKNELELFL